MKINKIYHLTEPVILLRGYGDARTKREVMCDKRSISQAEFFAADRASGLKPKLCLRIRSIEYCGETHCELNGHIYSIYRAYDPGDGFTELYLSTKAGEQ